MAAYTDSLGFNKGNAACFPANGNRSVTKVSVDLDFAAIATARAAAGVAALGAADTLDVIALPAGTAVLMAGVDVTTAEGAVCTMDLGDGSAATTYMSNVDLNAVAANGATVAAPVYYAAEDKLMVTIDSASTDTAVCRVWAIIVDCN